MPANLGTNKFVMTHRAVAHLPPFPRVPSLVRPQSQSFGTLLGSFSAKALTLTSTYPDEVACFYQGSSFFNEFSGLQPQSPIILFFFPFSSLLIRPLLLDLSRLSVGYFTITVIGHPSSAVIL